MFDYLVPDDWPVGAAVGDRVRVQLHGRRVGGWILELVDHGELPAEQLKPLIKYTGRGPDAEVISLARWAQRRWAARGLRPFLVAASPPRAVRTLPATARRDTDGAERRSARSRCPSERRRRRAGRAARAARRSDRGVDAARMRARRDAVRRVRAQVRRPDAHARRHRRRRAGTLGTGGIRGRRRDRNPHRRMGADRRSRRDRRVRRARRSPPGGALSHVARSRRSRSSGGTEAVWTSSSSRRCHPSLHCTGPGRGSFHRRSPTRGRRGRSSTSSTAAATSHGRRRSSRPGSSARCATTTARWSVFTTSRDEPAYLPAGRAVRCNAVSGARQQLGSTTSGSSPAPVAGSAAPPSVRSVPAPDSPTSVPASLGFVRSSRRRRDEPSSALRPPTPAPRQQPACMSERKRCCIASGAPTSSPTSTSTRSCSHPVTAPRSKHSVCSPTGADRGRPIRRRSPSGADVHPPARGSPGGAAR